jgi:hypothetical protein
VEPVHDDVARAQPANGLRQVVRNVFPVDIDYKRRLPGIVKTLADAHAEERWILLHQPFGHLLLDGN